MKSVLYLHVFVVLMAVVCLWSIRHERVERPVSGLRWALPPLLALIVATVLLVVSPGKRYELWIAAIVVGFALGLGAGVALEAIRDFEREVVRVQRTWDGVGAAALLLLLAIARLITSEFMNRPSGKFGVLGASAIFLAMYLAGRALTLYFYTAPKSIHLDMTEDGRRKPG